MQAHWRMRRKPGTFCWIAPQSPLLWPSWGELLTECVLHIIFLNRKVNFPPAHRNKYWASHFFKYPFQGVTEYEHASGALFSSVPTPASTLMGSLFQNSAVPPSSPFILNNPHLKRLHVAVSKVLPLALALFSALLPAPSLFLSTCLSALLPALSLFLSTCLYAAQLHSRWFCPFSWCCIFRHQQC